MVRVLARDHHRHVVVEDLDGQVVTGLTHELPGFLQDHDAGTVMRVDDVVAFLVRALDGRDLLELDLLLSASSGMGCLLWGTPARRGRVVGS